MAKSTVTPELKERLDIYLDIFNTYRVSNGELFAGESTIEEAIETILSNKEKKEEVLEKTIVQKKPKKKKMGFFKRFFFSEYEGEDY